MAGLLRRGLVEEGHAADVAGTGEDAVWMAQAHQYEAIVLDVMLPGLTGFETCRRLRSLGIWAPVLMLTARDGVDDRVAGLDVGADDYLTKPPDRARRRRPATRSRVTPWLARRGGDPPLAEGVRTPGGLHASPRPGSHSTPTARARLGLRLRESFQRRRRLRSLSAGEGRPTVRHGLDRDGARRRLSAAAGKRLK